MLDNSKPLAMVRPGDEVKIAGLNAGRGLAQRLTEMGLIPGQTITVISNHMPGPLIISLHCSRLVLGCGVAQKIMVERRSNGKGDNNCPSGQPQLGKDDGIQ